MKRLVIILFACFLIASCNDELKVNADWKDVSIIYGVLDKTEDTNYVRIHRGYLGNEGITGGKDDPDSLYYDVLNVVIEEYRNGNFVNSHTLAKDESLKLDTGFFTTAEYHTYRFDHQIVDGNEYRLIVDKEEDNLDPVYASTPIVGDFTFIKPQNNPNVKLKYAPRGQEMEWYYATDGRLYQPVIRFHYVELDKFNFSDSVHKYVDYSLPARSADNLNGDGRFEYFIDLDSYYTFLYLAIGENDDVIRFYRGSDYLVYAAADDLATYMSVNAPSNSIVQDKPQFTNITGGDGSNAGIFSSTNILLRENLDLNNPSYFELQEGDITCNLHFAFLVVSTFDTCYCHDGQRICL